MTKTLTIRYPKEELKKGRKETVASRIETFSEQTTDDILSAYRSALLQGYSISVSLKTDEMEAKEAGSQFESSALDYKASIRFLDKTDRGSYDYVKKLAQIIESKDFDYTVSVKLTVSDESLVNFDKPDSWTVGEDDALYQIKPKASSGTVSELMPLYQALKEEASVVIDIKPKKPKEDNLGAILEIYPDDTLVTFTLKETEIGGEETE